MRKDFFLRKIAVKFKFVRCNVQVAVKYDSMSRLRWRGSQIFSSKPCICRSFGEIDVTGFFCFSVLLFCSDVVVLTKEREHLFIRICLFFRVYNKRNEERN